MAKKSTNAASSSNGVTIGYEAQLWQMADALRNNMDAAEYKHVVLGLIFLKYISDAFEGKHAELEALKAQGADAEDPDEYRAASIFWVPKEARWQHLKASAPQPTIGTLVDEAMAAIERDNPSLNRHLATAERRGFPNSTLLLLSARDESSWVSDHIVVRQWMETYEWLLREKRHSPWAGRCASYMEIFESELIEDGRLKEGGVTTFAGIPFDPENPYNYLEAKRLLQLAMNQLRMKSSLKRELGMNPKAPGRGAITGRQGVAVWDFLRLKGAKNAKSFTEYPHLTLSIEHDRLRAMITVPNGIKRQFRRRLVELGPDEFASLFSTLNQRLRKALHNDKGAAPWVVVVQRRYLTQRSSAIVDAELEYDLRTAFQTSRIRGKRVVKSQPQWLNATYNALTRKRSNLQVAIGASFPYSRSSTVGTRSVIDRVVDTWIACGPLLTAMGLKTL